jgi:hypothetical protein
MRINPVRSILVASAIVAFAVSIGGCNYVVPPLELGTPTPMVDDAGWGGIVNDVTESGGALHVDLSIVNNTGQWSAMTAAKSSSGRPSS